MNGESEHLTELVEVVPPAPAKTPFFQRTDWLSFAIATVLVLMVYLWTLAPEVGLANSGQYTVGAMYAGVPSPPGFPLWTIYAWLFTKLLPFSNIAWRVAISSAVAGALTCGVIALMVSRGGVMVMDGMRGIKRLVPKDEMLLRVVCGCVAGMGFGFDGAFWPKTVIPDPWPLSLLLFSLVLCQLMRWLSNPERKRYLCAACFAYGLTLTNSQFLLAAAIGLQIFVAIGKPSLGRDIFFADALMFATGFVAGHFGFLSELNSYVGFASQLRGMCIWVGIGMAVLCVGLIIATRSFITEWRAILCLGVMFTIGLSLYFYVPIASMTNPPINWGYPRTVEGFSHVLTRGQYEKPYPTGNLHRFVEQIQMYGGFAVRDFGLAYLAAALIPFCLLHRMKPVARKWLLGLLAVYVSTAGLTLVVLNPSNDRASYDLIKAYFTTLHLVLAVCAGCGLVLAGSFFARLPITGDTRETAITSPPLSAPVGNCPATGCRARNRPLES